MEDLFQQVIEKRLSNRDPALRSLFRCVGGHPPYDVANIIGDKQRARSIYCHPNRTSQRITACADKTAEHLLRCPRRMPVGKRDKNHFVTASGLTVPGAVQADERPARKTLRQ